MSEQNDGKKLNDIDSEFDDFIITNLYEEIEGLVLKIARIAFLAGVAATISDDNDMEQS